MVGKSGDKMILAVKLRRKINTRKKTGPICDRNGLSKSGVRTAARRLLFTKLFLSVTFTLPLGDRQLASIWCDDGVIRAFVRLRHIAKLWRSYRTDATKLRLPI